MPDIQGCFRNTSIIARFVMWRKAEIYLAVIVINSDMDLVDEFIMQGWYGADTCTIPTLHKCLHNIAE